MAPPSSDAGIPERVRTFVASHIASVAQLEVLLLLHANRDRAWSAESVATAMRMGRDWAEEQLRDLARVGLIQRTDGTYRYGPTPDVNAVVDATARTFETRRVALITMIATQPTRRVDSVFRAVRRRGDGDDG